MLTELYIRDFAIIPELRMKFGPGFNVLTGETGAGKSIILDAVSLILGGRADTTVIRTGSDRTYVEATFELTDRLLAEIKPELEEADLLDPDHPQTIVIAREVRDASRNLCRINGVTVRASLLKEVGEVLVGIHGQGDHLRLLNPRFHLPLLDAYTGLTAEREQLTEEIRALRALERERDELRRDERSRQQRLDMLQFQIEEIRAANLSPGEEDDLRAERTRLANMEQLMRAASEGVALLSGLEDAEIRGAIDLVGEAEVALAALARLDPEQKGQLERLQGLLSELTDIAGDLYTYQEHLEHDPARLNFIEERLELINRLKRKYGESIEAILQVQIQAEGELERLEHRDERLGELANLIERRLRSLGQKAAELSVKRQKAAVALAQKVERELGDLRMEAEFAVDFQMKEDPDGLFVGEKRLAFDESGFDRVEFLLSANPGEPPKPLARVASGGETARIMLALKTALAEVDDTPTLIFDEIDQGIGGRIGQVVGQKLWSLAGIAGHQVIIVTHLPQMAGFGDNHFQVQKEVDGGRTSTNVVLLDHQARVQELGAMLGTKEDLGIVGGRSILQEAESIKQRFRPRVT